MVRCVPQLAVQLINAVCSECVTILTSAQSSQPSNLCTGYFKYIVMHNYRMSAEFNFHDDLHPTCTLQTLFELQKTDTLCDVTVVVNEDEIRAHKVVLATASPYFRYQQALCDPFTSKFGSSYEKQYHLNVCRNLDTSNFKSFVLCLCPCLQYSLSKKIP